LGERDAAGVGGDDGVFFARRFDFAPEVALQVEVLDDGFDDPVALADQVQVVFEVAGQDEGGPVGAEEAAGPLLERVVDAFERGRIAVGLAGNDDVEQDGGNAGISEVRGDARAHSARTEDRDATDSTHRIFDDYSERVVRNSLLTLGV